MKPRVAQPPQRDTDERGDREQRLPAGPIWKKKRRKNGVDAVASRRRSTTGYDTYGSVAYAPVYDGSAVRVPRREEELQRPPQPRTRERTRRRALTRTQVQVREAG